MAAGDPELVRHLQAGLSADRAGDPARAEREYQAAAELIPDAAEPRILASRAAQRQLHAAAAEAWLRGALAVAPFRDDVRLQWAHQLVRMRRLAEAQVELVRLRASRHLDAEALLALEGALHLAAGRFDEAAAAYLAILERHANDATGLVGVAAVRASVGDLDGAASALERAQRAAPTWALPDYDLGLVQYRRGALAEAARATEAALVKDPAHVPALANLGAIYLRQSRVREAERVLDRALALAGRYAPALGNLGVLEYERGDMERAARMLAAASAAAPMVAQHHFNLAVTLYRLGRWDEARRQLDDVLRLEPQNEPARRNRRWIEQLREGAGTGTDLPEPRAHLACGDFGT
jgi:tetratricopeptide (TPR) repeat protein